MANSQFRASGTLKGRFIGMEKKKSAKGNPYAAVEVEVGGKKIKMTAFGESVIKDLDGYAKFEEFPFWAKLSSSYNNPEKVYTNVNLVKVYKDERETQDDLVIVGEIVGIGDLFSTKQPGKKVGKYVDVDTTSDEAYPEKVRLQLAFGTDISLGVGQIIKTYAYMEPKFGIWVIDGDVEKSAGGSMPEGATYMPRRKRQEVAADKKEAAAPKETAAAPAAAKAEPAKPAAGGSDEDIPW